MTTEEQVALIGFLSSGFVLGAVAHWLDTAVGLFKGRG